MHRLKYFLVTMILTLGLMVLPTAAQAQFDPCGEENVDGMIEAVTRETKEAQTSSTPREAVDILAAISAKVIALQSYCNGLSFAGDGSVVIEPIDLPEGNYIAILYNFDEKPFEATITALKGDCHEGMGKMSSTTLFSLETQTSNAQSIIDSEDCSASIEITSEGSWQLLITQLDPS